MKKRPWKIDWRKIAAIVCGVVLLVMVMFIAAATSGSYEDAGRTELPALNREQKVNLITSGKTLWRYLDEGQEAVADSGSQTKWRENKYDASGWKEAAGSFGAKDGERRDMGEGTSPNNLLIQYQADGSSAPVYLFRTELTIANPDSIRTLVGTIEYDDAVLLYINGELVWTGNVQEGGYDGLLDYGSSEGIGSPRKEDFVIKDTSMLKKGKNTVAVELHQNYSSGSDIYFDFLSLTGLTQESETVELDTSGLILEVGKYEEYVRVNWYTEELGAFEIRYGAKQGEEEPAAYVTSLMARKKGGVKGVYCYTAQISAPAAGEKFVYRIEGVGSNDASAFYTYQTPQAGNDFNFLFVGDPQIGAEDTTEDTARWEKALEKGLELAPDAAFLISAGDQVDSGNEERALQQYMGFRSPAVLKELPVAVIRGNHDGKTSLYERQFDRDEEEMEYSFLYGDVLFIALDSMAASLEQQAEFLRKTVEKYPAEWIVVIMHYSLFSEGSHAGDSGIIRARSHYAPIFSELGVDLVLAGHDHGYSRSFYMNGPEPTEKAEGEKLPGEVLYLTGGSSTGSKFYDATEQGAGYAAFTLEDQRPVITAISVKDKVMEIKTFDVSTGEEIDSIELKK